MNLKLQNIYNRGRKIWLFERVNKQLKITEVNNFYPYFFEPDPKGQFKGYGGKQLKKVTINEPNQIAKSRSGESYESDVLFTKRFLIDCVEQIEKTDPRYLFLDIEIIAKELPRTGEAPYPVSCITVYDSYEPGFKTWYLPDYTDEKQMLGSFVEYLKDVQPDMLLAWNIEFDYNYLANRIKNFGQEISPISEVRYGKDDTKYPAGISIVDYKGLYEKLTLGKKRSYALDYVAQDDLGENW